jgi:hypothetical protein
VPRQRISGTTPALPQYAFMAWCTIKKSTGTPLPLPTGIQQLKRAQGKRKSYSHLTEIKIFTTKNVLGRGEFQT